MNDLREEPLKDKKLRHAEYYGVQEWQDELFERSGRKEIFNNLMGLITKRDNIILAYRNIKGNKGSMTPSVDKKTISNIEQMDIENFVKKVKSEFRNYNPRMVRRKDIPKSNGKTRPLGIPSIWDRIVQQCILQVLEPICEAQFHSKSFGFRPNRSAEHSIVEVQNKINFSKLHYVVDVDIKGFFDNVNHRKLLRQLWTIGIRDKQLLAIIGKILRAPIKHTDGKVEYPTAGTPQGGILSPLLANVNLNEFDWWISSQWETREYPTLKKHYNSNGSRNRGPQYKKSKRTKLKPMFIVRYADDFKIFTNTEENAKKIFFASKDWLEQRLKLAISEEKSRITNLKTDPSEFLGFHIRARKQGKKNGKWKYVAQTNILPRVVANIRKNLKKQVKIVLANSHNQEKCIYQIVQYNLMVTGIHNYYGIAHKITQDLSAVAWDLLRTWYNRSQSNDKRKAKKTSNDFTRHGTYNGSDKSILKYKQNYPKQMRYFMQYPILPIGGIRMRKPMGKRIAVQKYTKEGRKEIHRNLSEVNETTLEQLRKMPIGNSERSSLKLYDNRISLFVAQKGKCHVTGIELTTENMRVHHKKLWSKTKDDTYKNLVLVSETAHLLIHATKDETINYYLNMLKLNTDRIKKLNKLRNLIELPEINPTPIIQ